MSTGTPGQESAYPDLVSWVRTQLDTDEAHARKDLWALDRATPGVWTAYYGHNLPYSVIKGEGGVEIARFEAQTGPLPDGADDLHAADILLVVRLVRKARERAERALARVQAHREILARHYSETFRALPGVYCGQCSDDYDAEDWPCPDVRSLVSIYRDSRPGFDPSWLPEDS